MKATKESGFSDILIAILAFLMIVGLATWLILSSQPKQQPVPPSGISQNPQSQPAGGPNEGYVVIGEWGVRFKTGQDLSPIIYSIGVQTELSEANVTFSTEALARYGESCAGKVSGRTPLGVLVRSHSSVSNTTPANGEFTKQIDNYLYRYIAPQAACADNSAAADKLQTDSLAVFKSLITKLEANSVTIKEWGIKFKPIAPLGEVMYFKTANTDGHLDFTTKELIEREPHCAYTGFASLQRSKTPVEPHELFIGKIADYYYYYRGSGTACSEHDINFPYESQLRNSFKESLKSLQKADSS